MLGSIGAGLNHCHVPDTATQDNYLRSDEVEVGVGIHNESGIEKRKLPSAKELITQMLSYITNTADTERAFLAFKHDGKDQVVLMVNSLGGISKLEMGLIVQEALSRLDEQGISVLRVTAGSFTVSPPPSHLNSSPTHIPPDIMQPFRLQPRPPLPPREADQPKHTRSRILELLDAPASARDGNHCDQSSKLPKRT